MGSHSELLSYVLFLKIVGIRDVAYSIISGLSNFTSCSSDDLQFVRILIKLALDDGSALWNSIAKLEYPPILTQSLSVVRFAVG